MEGVVCYMILLSLFLSLSLSHTHTHTHTHTDTHTHLVSVVHLGDWFRNRIRECHNSFSSRSPGNLSIPLPHPFSSAPPFTSCFSFISIYLVTFLGLYSLFFSCTSSFKFYLFCPSRLSYFSPLSPTLL